MLKTLDIIDNSIAYMFMLGEKDTFVSMPILSKNPETGDLCYACFCWQSTSKKQLNVPKPEHIVYTPITAGEPVCFEAPTCKMPDVCRTRSMSFWTMRSLANQLDEIVNDYLATGKLTKYKYLYYLENMVENYTEDFYPLIRALNLEGMTIEALEENDG